MIRRIVLRGMNCPQSNLFMLKKTVLTFAFLSILTTFYGFNAQTGTPVTDPSPVLEPAPKSVGTNALAKERLCVNLRRSTT